MAHQLTPEELVALTGAKLADRQKAVLQQNRVPFLIDARQRPVTTWEAVNRALVGMSLATPTRDGFNLAGAQ